MRPMHDLRAVEIEPDEPARSAVIWLHGLGADGHDFAPIATQLNLPPELRIRWVFPHAPAIPVTINGGLVMPAWYDIAEVDLERRHDAPGVRASAARLRDLIARERARGVASEQIVLGGFSQGGAVALFAALRHEEPLAGVVAFSTYLVLPETLEQERHAANGATKILQAHGSLDDVVQPARGAAARDTPERLGHAVEFHEYKMEHSVCLEQLRALAPQLVHGRLPRQVRRRLIEQNAVAGNPRRVGPRTELGYARLRGAGPAR